MAIDVRRGLRLGCGVAVVLFLVAAFGALFIGACQDSRREDKAEDQIGKVEQLVATGEVEEAATLFLSTFVDYFRTDVLADDGRLDAVLRKFSAPDLAILSARALVELPTPDRPVDRGVSSGERVSALCDAAILGAYPDAPEAAAARERLVTLLGLTPGAPSNTATPASRSTAVRGLSYVTDPAFLEAMVGLVNGPEYARFAAASVLASMGERGVNLLVPLLGSGDAELRLVLALGLCDDGSGAAVQAVRTALKSPEGLVRLDASAAAAAAANQNNECPWEGEAIQLLVPYAADPYVVAGAPVVFIQEGRPESVQAMIDGLAIVKDPEMAERMVNSGNDELRAAASAWARANGYTIETKPASPGSPGIQWGEK
ncbi:MAG: hypothetical protein IH609_17710 [Dehalococcoidia bacterium]|nr:hypothetical protein [Dehalococcoidia bacterium]